MQLNLTTKQLWQFSLNYYNEQAHAQALIELQDTCGANVNLCLLLKYCEKHAIALTLEEIAVLHHAVTKFNLDFTLPLRLLRKQVKTKLSKTTNYPHLRQHLLNAELELEKQEQSLLIDCVSLNMSNRDKRHCSYIKMYLFEVLEQSHNDVAEIVNQLD